MALRLGVEGTVGDIAADADQLPQGGPLADDARVGLDVRHRRRVLRQLGEVSKATHLGQLPFAFELLGERHHIDRLVGFGEFVDGAEDQAMVMAVEVTIGHGVGDALPGVVVEHQATQHRLFGFDRVRRHLEGSGLQVVLLGDGDVVHGRFVRALRRNSKAEKTKARYRISVPCPMLAD